MDCEKLIKDLYIARQNHRQARKGRREQFERIGNCEFDLSEEENRPCYHINRSKWCDPCKQRQLVNDEYVIVANLAGVALRKVLAAGKKLS